MIRNIRHLLTLILLYIILIVNKGECMKYLFGPVNSRRLGISLGIDLLPYKTCSLDCIYCECGSTTLLTTERREYVNTVDVINELNEYLSSKPNLDYITFSGSGEPTLHSGIGKIISFLKSYYPEYRICVLTNSTLLHLKEVRDEIISADVIVPSLDAMTDDSLHKILRPHDSVTIGNILNGISSLYCEFSGKIIIEYFVIPGVNDSNEEIDLLKRYLMTIDSAVVQLNYLSRPGAEKNVPKASYDQLKLIAGRLSPVNVQIIDSAIDNLNDKEIEKAVFDKISTYSTTDDLSLTFGLRKSDMIKILKRLEDSGLVESFDSGRWRRKA